MTESRLSSDAVEWAYKTFIEGKPDREASFREARRQSNLAQRIYDIREKFHMSREDLAEFSGLTAETIEDIEETDYDGNWDEAIEKINTGFRNWFTNVVLPASRMKPEEYTVEVVGPLEETRIAG
ncbi:MAG: helix-turn-helix transcriptional regulator [Thermodesulfobacteriota bacterium]